MGKLEFLTAFSEDPETVYNDIMKDVKEAYEEYKNEVSPMVDNLTKEQRIWNAAARVSATLDQEFFSAILDEEELPPDIVTKLVFKILTNLDRLYSSTSKCTLARFLMFDYLDSCGRLGEEDKK